MHIFRSFLRIVALNGTASVAAIAAVSSLTVSISEAVALPPAQTIFFAGTDAPLMDDGPTLAVAVYGWALGADKALGLYVGPSFSFMDDKLAVQVKAGAYVADEATPLLNLELYYENGNFEADWFNDFYYDANGPVGVYSWLSAQYWHKSLTFGAMADVTKDSGRFQLNAGPMIGFGTKQLNIAVVPVYIKTDPSEPSDGMGVRVLVNIEFAAAEEEEERTIPLGADKAAGADEAAGDKSAEPKADEAKADDAKADDAKAEDKKDDKKGEAKEPK